LSKIEYLILKESIKLVFLSEVLKWMGFKIVAKDREKDMRKKISIINVFKIICLIYLAVGLVIWFISICNTDYTHIAIHKKLVGVDGHTSYMWEQHDKTWTVYYKYALPFIILTLPIYIIMGLAVSDGKISFMLHDIICLYLLFIPGLILWSGIVIKKAICRFRAL